MSGCQGSMLSVLTVSPCLQMYVMTVAACLQNTTSFRESPLQTEWKYLLQVKLLLLLQLHVMETRKRFFFFVLPWMKSLSCYFVKSLTETNVDRGRKFADKFLSVQLYHISSWRRHITSFSRHNTENITPNICHWFICWKEGDDGDGWSG